MRKIFSDTLFLLYFILLLSTTATYLARKNCHFKRFLLIGDNFTLSYLEKETRKQVFICFLFLNLRTECSNKIDR